jgi:putative sugar ABC transporter, sugar-binding protein
MKKRMLNKVLASVLAGAMAVSMLTGCSSNGNTNSSSQAASTQESKAEESKTEESKTEEAAASTDEEVTIKIAAWDASSSATTTPLIEGFEKAHPNIKVELIDIASADYTQKLSVMLNGGNDLDVVWIKDADTTPTLAGRGQLEDLTPYIERDGIDLGMYNGLAEPMNMGGKQVAVPTNTSYYILYYNKDIFDEAGVDYPTNDMTWADFEELAAKVTIGEGSDKKYGALLHTWQACVINWGIAEGKESILSTDYSFLKPYYEMALRLQDAGYVMDYSTLKTGNIHYSSPFLQGQVAMMPMGSWFMATIINKINAGESNIHWGIATLPHAESIEAGYTVGATTPMGINANSKNKDAAWEFVKFVSGAEGAQIYAENGDIPASKNDEVVKTIVSIEGMPEGAEEALQTKNIALDRPMDEKSAEVNQMIGEEHSLIMIGELSVDDGLAEMAERSKEIQGK